MAPATRSTRSRRTPASLLIWLLRVAGLAMIWLALTDSRNAQELAVGAVVVAIAALLIAALARPRSTDTLARLRAPFRLGAGPLVRQLWNMVADSIRVGIAAARALATRRPLAGEFRAAPYAETTRRRGVGGRIATEALGSLAPNRYVVGVDEDAGQIVIHELIASDEPIDPFGG